MKTYYVHHNGSSWFVKEGSFFIAQGGLVKPWGKAWRGIQADSIEDARNRAESSKGTQAMTKQITNPMALGIVRELRDRADKARAQETKIQSEIDAFQADQKKRFEAEVKPTKDKFEEESKLFQEMIIKEWDEFKEENNSFFKEDFERLRLACGLATWSNMALDWQYIDLGFAFIKLGDELNEAQTPDAVILH